MRFFLCFILISLQLVAEENAFLYLKGYLGKDELSTVKLQVEDFSKAPPKTLAIAINSSSADLNELLGLAKQLYALKLEKGTKIVVYIDDSALGPAAILPFLADELDSSLFVAWGDIPLSAENSMPTNILSNRVVSLIPQNMPKTPLLDLLATAMTDPKAFVIDDHGWKLSSNENDTAHTRISVLGQTLVVNHNQLQELGLLNETLPVEQFIARYVKKPSEPAVKEPPIPANEQALQQHIKFNPHGPNKIGHIAINDRSDSINQSTWIYVKNALDYYMEHKPIFIILELNTPGGEVFAAETISDALVKMDTQYNIPVVAFINNWAMSAGALLAYSSRFIAVTKDASMGAAEPVIQTAGGGMESASEKINSAFRTDFASRAKFFDRNPYIAEAMVDKDTIVVMRHGKIIKLDNEQQIRTTGPDADVLISPKGKLLTLNAEQLIEYGVANIYLPPKQLPEITSQEQISGKWPFSKELLSENSFFSAIPEATIDTYEMDWKTRLFVFLANPVVQSVLFLGLMLGFYMELNNPGMTLPGTIALICLLLIILSSFSQELGSWLEVIMLVVGLGIVLVEIFVLPTFGILGFIGIALFLIGLFSLMLPGIGSISFEHDTKTFNAAGQAFLQRLTWLSATFIIGLVMIALMARYLMPSFGGFKRFVLEGHEQTGYIASVDPHDLPAPGAKGIALTHLRPAGKVVIDDKIYDALSVGRFIEKDVPVRIARLDGSTLFVMEEKES